MSDNEKGWSAPPELAGALKVKTGHTKQHIQELEELAESLEWKVISHEKCPVCERIKRGKK